MQAARVLYAGIDPSSAQKAFAYGAVDGDLNLVVVSDGELEDVLGWVKENEVAVVAVNSPSAVNRGVLRERLRSERSGGRQIRGADIRLAEYQLRSAGVAVTGTPGRAELCSPWMQRGFQLYAALAEQGYRRDLDGSAPRLLETHPEACFHLLLGRNLFPKPTLEGRLQRQLILHDRGLRIKDPMLFFEEITRFRFMQGVLPEELVYRADYLDVLAAAYTAWLAANEPHSISMLGDESEGLVAIPAVYLSGSGG